MIVLMLRNGDGPMYLQADSEILLPNEIIHIFCLQSKIKFNITSQNMFLDATMLI